MNANDYMPWIAGGILLAGALLIVGMLALTFIALVTVIRAWWRGDL